MTEVSQRARTAESAAGVVTGFFDRYRAHDVEGMTDLCSINAGFSYVPVEMWGKQRVLRGDGTVGTVGKPLWTGLIASFPDLAVAVHTITSNDDGDVVAQVDLEGTQQLPWGLITPAGRHYLEPHLFIFHVGPDLLIDSITAYWNDAGISQQLGHNEVDLPEGPLAMALLKREEWQGFVRDVDWSYSYVDDEAAYPEWHSGTGKVPREAWSGWEESYKVSYPEYVATQREKEAAAYAVKAALQRSASWDSLNEGWKSATKMHFGGVALSEYAAVLAELKMARFGLTGAWRNMAVFGELDELRHSSITTFFGHEFIGRDPQYDWTQKAFQTNDWVAIALRNMFDAMMSSANVVDIALQLPLVFETGFTNLQFVALAADALASGDVNFANMISSIQTDEARHSQQGGPTLEILVQHDPARAQWVVDKSFWASARALAALTGPSMDYYTPLEHRKQSYREFMEEWIIDQFIRSIEQYGLKKPWYWDEFMRGLDIWHHGLHMGLWFWRPTLWWRPMAAVSPDERAWLAEKYPNWEKVYGDKWDVIIDNVNAGNIAATLPETLPWLCSTCHLPACNATQSRDGTWRVRDVQLQYDGRTYHFCTNGCRQIFWKDRSNVNHQTVVDRFLAGQIQPMDVGGILGYMGLTPDVMGDDPDYQAWTKDYVGRPAEGLAAAAQS